SPFPFTIGDDVWYTGCGQNRLEGQANLKTKRNISDFYGLHADFVVKEVGGIEFCNATVCQNNENEG
ncbi:hypothetical protein M1146_07655, partial [Patescibacteria group bacterium]|nr:hypothetical protein [Patescibacteria group bacterium]